MSRVPKLRAPYTSMPIQNSHAASAIQVRSESGGIVRDCLLHGLSSGNRHVAIFYLHLRRVLFAPRAAAGSSIVITLLPP